MLCAYFKCVVCFAFTYMSLTCRNYTWNTLKYYSSFIKRKISEISYLGYKCGNTLENERDICTYTTYGMQKILLIIDTNLYYFILCKTKRRCLPGQLSNHSGERERKSNKSRPKWRLMLSFCLISSNFPNKKKVMQLCNNLSVSDLIMVGGELSL